MFDARQVLRPQPGGGRSAAAPPVAADVLGGLIDGMAQLKEKAQLSMAGVVALSQELRNLGAVHVTEIAADEWERQTAWCSLLPFEQRRLLRAVR